MVGDRIEGVAIITRSTESPVVVVISQFGLSLRDEKIMKAQTSRNRQPVGTMTGRKTQEINPHHPRRVLDLMAKVEADTEDIAARDAAQALSWNALIDPRQEIVEVIWLIPQDRVSERVVEQTVDASVPQIRKPVMKVITGVDVPVTMQAKVPAVQVVHKTVEIPQAHMPNKVVHTPCAIQHQGSMVQKVQMTRGASRLQFIDEAIHTPIVTQSDSLEADGPEEGEDSSVQISLTCTLRHNARFPLCRELRQRLVDRRCSSSTRWWLGRRREDRMFGMKPPKWPGSFHRNG